MPSPLPEYWNDSEFLPEYIRLGLSEIVVTDHTFREESRGWGDEHITETIVARKGNLFVKLSASAHHQIGFGSGGGQHVGPEEPISESEYKKLAADKKAIDTPEARQGIEQQQARTKRHYELENKLHQMAPTCPDCGAKLTWRNGKRGPFWGCPNFKRLGCRGSKTMSPPELQVFEEFYRT